MLIGIVIGIILCVCYQKIKSHLDNDVIQYRQYFEYSSDASKAYNELSKYFIEHTDVLELKSLKYVNAYSLFNISNQHHVIARYKLLDKSFKVDFKTK